ncbi:isoform C [Brachionus plicatilis]|uniref:Isoform C n=1 Tax=Brachionus plicatilis TaxID=10195 RepID=A0A3M7PXZ1_BRAPC|nr:isoform C [Brachionus plicatilis]
MDEEKAKEHRRPSNFPRRSFRDMVNKSISILLNPNNNNANNNPRRLDHNLQSHSTLDTDTLSSPGSKTSLEFPGQRLTSISETSTQFSSMSIENEIENFYKSAQECDSKNVPILLPMDSDNFLIEGYVSQHDYALSIGKGNEYFIHEEEIFPTNQAYVNYAKYYFKKEHFNFVGKYENNELLNFVLSIRYENDKFECIFSYPHMETITIKESDFLANGTDSDHEENCESDFEEVGVAICKLSLNPSKKKFLFYLAVKKVLSKHKNPIACTECGKLMKHDGNRYEEFEIKELFDKTKMESQDENSLLSFANVSSIFDKINHNMPPHEIRPIIHPIASGYINTYDKNLLKNTFTFGIIYQKCGQKNEKEILGNSQHSKEFDEFLDFIGQRICLRNFDKFRGMLDIKNNDTGTESVYEVHDGSEIMFHVSTMLPLSNKDQQNIERKRHIGNDRVTIIFQDSDTVFSPRIIKSKLLHVFMIIQPVIIDGVTKRYKVV